jgi:hypothetical protein
MALGIARDYSMSVVVNDALSPDQLDSTMARRDWGHSTYLQRMPIGTPGADHYLGPGHL